MAQAKVSTEKVKLHVKNIGGITDTTVKLTPGTTILTGRNATNRTSLLQAIMGVLGSDAASIKGDAEEGRVELTIGETTYTRRLYRENDTIKTSGEPYLDDASIANLFAFLLETNDARQAVARGEDLRDVIMRPVDTNQIENQINHLRSQRDEIDSQIEEISELKEKLPEIEREKSDIEDKLARKRDEIKSIGSDIESIDMNIDQRRREKEKFEDKLESLNEIRSNLEDVRHQVNSQENSLDALREERSDLIVKYEEYDDIPKGKLDDINNEINRLHQQKNKLNNKVDELQTVIQFNEDLLDGDTDIFNELRNKDSNNITDQLSDASDDLICWTCGSEIDTKQIEVMLDNLRDLRNEYMSNRGNLDSEINELNEQRQNIEKERRQHSQIETQLDTIDSEIEERESRIEELKTRRDELTNQAEDLEEEIEDLQTNDQQDSKLLELHKKSNQLEVEIDRLESDLENTENEIEDIENRIAEREELKSERDGIQTEIQELRTRVEYLEKDAISKFNNHMEAILDILNYDNLERIWIERTEEEVQQGRKTTTEGRFDLHVVRLTESDTVYEDTIDHLSESEREVTGLVFALAGYLVHDVHEEVPFMLLDSIEAIDAPRLADLINYFNDQVEYLVVALLEEDAKELDSYHRIRDI